MPRLQLPLLVKLVLALALMGLLPLAITYVQLREQGDALLDQVQRTHIVAATTAADRAAAFVASLGDLVEATAAHPALASDARSRAAQELLRGTLRASGGLAALGVFKDDGEQVLLARRPELEGEVDTVNGEVGGARPVELVEGASRRWLRLRRDVPGTDGHVVALADAVPLAEIVDAHRLGTEARLVLASADGGVLLGGDTGELGIFPPELLEQAWSGKLDSGARRYADGDAGGVLVTAYARVEGTPWAVLSRQPGRVAEAARRRIQAVTWQAAGLALALTVLLAAGGFFTVVAPIRRLAAAQAELAGEGVGGGSEIARLEASFELLRKRIRDSEDLGQIFLGRYQVTDLVGSGAMGSVFRGWDDRLRRPVALKTVHLDAEAVDHEKLLRGLREEAAITARIHQPNIVTVYDIEEQGASAFIAMEYVDGVNLQKLLRHRGGLDVGATVALGAAIARGLATAHDAGLVHHDVKPANILLGRDGAVKLTDFGVSQLISDATHARDVICGTPGYLAPECFEGGEYGPGSDLWAFGVVLYECLLGYNPFRGRQLRITVARTLSLEPEPVVTRIPEVPEELSRLISQLLAKDPDHRRADAGIAAEALEHLAESRGYTWDSGLVDLAGAGDTSERPREPPASDGEAPTQLLSVSG